MFGICLRCSGPMLIFYSCFVQTDSIKRSVPNTPSKAASPQHKKLHVVSPLKSPLKSPMKSLEKKRKGKLKIFNPRKLKRKLGEFFGGISPTSTNKIPEDADTSAHVCSVLNKFWKQCFSLKECGALMLHLFLQPLAILNEKPVEVQGPSVVLVKRRKSLVSNGSQTSSLNVSISELVTPMRDSVQLRPMQQTSFMNVCISQAVCDIEANE